MMQHVWFLIGLALVVFVWIQRRRRQEQQRKGILWNNSTYRVLHRENSQQAAQLLHQLNQAILELISHLQIKFPSHPAVLLIQERYRPENVVEGDPNDKVATFTENKGERVVMCLRNRETDELHDFNLLLYPMIHELAHHGVPSYTGHGREFQETFAFLLKEAQTAGIYTPIDFQTTPQKYCNLTITDAYKH